MKEINGIDIREVWDFRLSIASPILYVDGDTWVVKIYANDGGGLLEEHDTGVESTGDVHDTNGTKACFEWLYSVRDKYSRDHIELRKPVVKMINEANTKAASINLHAQQAKQAGDVPRFNEKMGELSAHLSFSNAAIKAATQAFHDQLTEGGAV